MKKTYRLVYKGSPFLPQIDVPQLIQSVRLDLSPTFEPAAAIALNICPIMAVHSTLLQLDEQVLVDHRTSPADLHQLTLGYQFPLETIQASAVCRKLAPGNGRNEVYEQLAVPTHNYTVLRIQEAILKNLNATCNLLEIDPSGSLVFQYLKDYPFTIDEYFENGMEIAAHIFFGAAIELTKVTGNSSWLNTPYDPTIT